MQEHTRVCACGHTSATHHLTWSVVPTCDVLWCACPRFRPVGVGAPTRLRLWWAWRRSLARVEAGAYRRHRLEPM